MLTSSLCIAVQINKFVSQCRLNQSKIGYVGHRECYTTKLNIIQSNRNDENWWQKVCIVCDKVSIYLIFDELYHADNVIAREMIKKGDAPIWHFMGGSQVKAPFVTDSLCDWIFHSSLTLAPSWIDSLFHSRKILSRECYKRENCHKDGHSIKW